MLVPARPRPSAAPRWISSAGFLPLLLTAAAPAATSQVWNAGGTGGEGIWGTGPAEQNWNTAVGAAGPNIAWPVSGDHVATFQDALGGTVTVFGEVTAAGIQQDGAGYTIDGGIIRLENGAEAGLPGIAVASGTLSIASALAGDDGLSKTGAGTLTLSGLNGFTGPVQLAGGTMVLAGPDQLPDSGALTLAGGTTLVLSAGGETVGSLVSTGGTISGGGVLSAATYELNDGTLVSGHLGAGVLTTAGTVQISGTSAATTVSVGAGTLVLDGSERLSDVATVNVAGTLELGASETVGALAVNGGTVTGPGLLTAESYTLNDGSQVSGNLGTGWLATAGNVLLSGSALGSVIQVTGGILTNTGTLGTAGSQLDIAAGARLIADGVQNFALLTTSGSGTGTWQGNLTNQATVAPGGIGAAGTLRIDGDFANAPGGTLLFDIGAGGSDRLQVTGLASFGGLLDLRQLGSAEIAAMVPYQLIDAGSYAGNFDSLAEDLSGAVIFNPANGSITRLDAGSGASFLTGATANQASVWTALYDDVVDPGTTNVRHRPGQIPPYDITGGIASDDEPSLLWALDASLTPDGLDVGLLNRLSPEVYLSLPDYAIQATRHHRRTAWNAPALASSPASTGSKDAKSVVAPPSGWEFFAAADWFDGETSGSLHQADYQLTGTGVVAGARLSVTERLRFAAYLAGDDGEIRGALIDADGSGISTGLLGEWMIDPETSLRVTGGIAYGSYSFDGSRGSAVATPAGWSPGLAAFSDVDADAFDLHFGIDAVAWQSGRVQVMPSMGLAYTTGTADAFREAGGAAIPLAVDGSHRDSFVAEFALAARLEVTRRVHLDGEFGFNLDLRDDPERVSARFAAGNRALAATGTPLADDLAFLGLGATWVVTDDVSVRLGYRAEFRSEAETLDSVAVSSGFRF